MFRDQRSRRATGNCGAVACSELTVADLPGYGDPRADNRPRRASGKPARAWNTRHSMLKAEEASATCATGRGWRSRSTGMLQRILRTVDADTYVVLTSDNGFHLGQRGLVRGKGSAYDTDVRVPLLITGPGVVPGSRARLTSNIDLAPTFEELAGLSPAPYRSGVSLVADR